MSFDELPVGTGTGANPFGAGAEAAPVEEEKFQEPLNALLVHKKWKARRQGYEELNDLINSGGDFEEYASLLGKISADSNAAALSTGMKCVLQFVSKMNNATAVAAEVMAGIVKSGLKGRTDIRKLSGEVCAMLVECGAVDSVLGPLVAACKHRQVKIAVAAIEVINELLLAFGPVVVPIKEAVKSLGPCLSNRRNDVRAAGFELCKQAYRWMGDIFRLQTLPALKLQAQQAKAVEEHLATVEDVGQLRPTRLTREEQARRAKSKKGGGRKANTNSAAERKMPAHSLQETAEEEEEEEEPAFDPMSLVEPTDVCAALPSKWMARVQQKKWVTRRDAFVQLQSACTASPKILVSGATREVVSIMKRVLARDPNVNVVAACCKCISALFKGTERGSFVGPTRTFLPYLFDWLKEKKITVNKPVNDALDQCVRSRCVAFPDMLEEIKAALGHKVPKVRAETLKFVERIVSAKDTRGAIIEGSARSGPMVTPVGKLCVKYIVDTDPTIRSAAMDTMVALVRAAGGLQRHQGLSTLAYKLEQKEPKKFKQLSNRLALDAAAPPSKPGRRGSVSGVSVGAKAPSQKKPVKGSRHARSRTAMPKSGGQNPLQAAATAAQAPESDEKVSADDALGTLRSGGWLSQSVVAAVRNPKWDVRRDALLAIAAAIAGKDTQGEEIKMSGWDLDAVHECALPVMSWLGSVVSWAPNNFHVSNALYSVVTGLAARYPLKWPRKWVDMVMEGICKKIGDGKCFASLSDALFALAAATTPAFVLAQLQVHGSKVRNVKAHEKLAEWTAACVEGFSLKRCGNMQGIVKMAHAWIQSRNPKVRQQAVTLCCTLFRVSGRHESVRDMLVTGLSGSTVRVLEAALDEPMDKYAGPTRHAKKLPEGWTKGSSSTAGSDAQSLASSIVTPASSSSSSSFAAESKSEAFSVEDSDLTTIITPELLAQLDHKSWRERKVALEQAAALVKGHHGIAPSKDAGIFEVLGRRLGDTNRKLIRPALMLIDSLVSKMHPSPENMHISRHLQRVVPLVLGLFADSNKHIKDTTQTVTGALFASCGVAMFVKSVCDVLQQQTNCRLDLLTLVRDHMGGNSAMPELIAPCLACIEDKQSTVRTVAEEVLTQLVRQGLMKTIKARCRGLRKANMLAIGPCLDRLKAVDDEINGRSRPPAATASKPAPPQTPRRRKPRGTARKHVNKPAKQQQAPATPSAEYQDAFGLSKNSQRMARTPVKVSAALPACFSLDLDELGMEDGASSKKQQSVPAERKPTQAPTSSLTASEEGVASLSPAEYHESKSRHNSPLEQSQEILPSDSDVTRLLLAIETGASQSDRIGCMKVIWSRIQRGEDPAKMIGGSGDRIVRLLGMQVDASFFEEQNGAVLSVHHRLCTYAFNLLIDCLESAPVVASVSQHTCEVVLTILLSRLLDRRLRARKTEDVLAALNQATIKMLELVDRTMSFVVLISMMGNACRDDGISQKFVDLAIKCLAKLIGALPDCIAQVDVPVMLKAMHDYFVEFPPATRKARTSGTKEEGPLRSFRALLFTVFRLLGESAAVSAMSSLPSTSLVISYMNTIINHSNGAAEKPKSGAVPENEVTQGAPQSAASPAGTQPHIQTQRCNSNVQSATAPASPKAGSALELATKLIGSRVQQLAAPPVTSNVASRYQQRLAELKRRSQIERSLSNNAVRVGMEDKENVKSN